MKKVFKIFVLTAIILTFLNTTAYADIKITTLPADKDGNSSVLRECIPNEKVAVNAAYGCDFDDVSWQGFSLYKDNELISGITTHTNFDSNTLGVQTVNFKFTPDDASLPEIEYTEKVLVRMNIKNSKSSEDEDAVTSLVETNIVMEPNTNYTPHLNDMIEGSEYEWTSSDKSVAVVNKKTGKIISKSEGSAIISCKVETPYDDTYTIKLTVNVSSGMKASRSAASNTIYLSKGDKQTLTTDYDESTESCFYKSNKSSVISVDGYTGKITAKKAGEAYILCTITGTDYSVRTVRYDIVVE